jgi:hypothetical protein
VKQLKAIKKWRERALFWFSQDQEHLKELSYVKKKHENMIDRFQAAVKHNVYLNSMLDSMAEELDQARKLIKEKGIDS